MRDIKYQAFVEKNIIESYPAAIYSVENICWRDGKLIAVNLLPCEWIDIQWVTLREYTGLKDKNGKEIYEGDIVIIEDTYKEQILDDGSGPIEPFNHLALVVFEHAEFGTHIKDSGDVFCSGFWSFAMIERETGQNEFEVIGNIYENPGLLIGVS